jgi:hypothetical protein
MLKSILNELKKKLSNYNNKHVKLVTVAICASIVLIFIYISYSIFKSKIEGFAIPWNQPLYKGEPLSLNPQWTRPQLNNITFELITSNNSTQFGLSMGMIYVYSNSSNYWTKITNKLSDVPITTANSSVTTTTIANATQINTRCPYGSIPIIVANSKTLFYYNTSNNNGCFWYLLINNINTTSEWLCLPLPKQNSTTDKLRLITINEKYIFAIGCYNTGNFYYCSLNESGLPVQINGNYWNTLQTASMPNTIQLLTCTDSGIFYVSSRTYTTAQPTAFDNITTTANKITYTNIGTPNSDGTLNSNWITNWGIDDPKDTVIINNITAKNDIMWVVDVGSRTTGNSKLWWYPLLNGLPNTNRSWNYLDSPVSSIINITIISNTLLLLGSQAITTKLYDPSEPATTLPITTRPNTTRPNTTRPNTTRPNTTRPNTTVPLTTRSASTGSSGSASTGSSGSASTGSSGSASTGSSGSASTGSSGSASTGSSGSVSNIGTSSNSNEPLGASESSISGAELSSLPSSNYRDNDSEFVISGNADNYVLPENNLNGLSNNYLTFTPSDNQNNMNDFISNNTLLGNNLYISPMYGMTDETGLSAGVNMSPYQNMTTVTDGATNRKISSFFFPMVKMN